MRITTEQKHKLKQLMECNPELRSGKFSPTFTRKDAAEKWQQITEILNSIPGAQKEWKSWRKTWQDIQSKIKSKSAAINRVRQGTGGGPPPDPLDDFEQGVADLLHPHAVSGHNNSTESVVVFEDPSTNMDAVEWIINIPPLPSPLSPENPATPPPAPPPQFASQVLAEQASQSSAPRQVQKRKKTNLKTLLREKLDLKKEALKQKKDFYDQLIKTFERHAKA